MKLLSRSHSRSHSVSQLTSTSESFYPQPLLIHPSNLTLTPPVFPPNEQLPRAPSYPLPLLQHHDDLVPDILDDKIHLDAVAMVAEWIFELAADAVDAVQREGDQHDDGDHPPAQIVHERKRQGAAEEGENLFLVDLSMAADVS